jgi:hypothetical protein
MTLFVCALALTGGYMSLSLDFTQNVLISLHFQLDPGVQ